MFVDFIVYNIKHNPLKIIKYSIENSVFLFYGISKCKCVSWFWECGNLTLEIFSKDSLQTLTHTLSLLCFWHLTKGLFL